MSSEKNRGFATGAAIGAVAGVLVGILFAPKSGKETRQDIKDTGTKVAEKLQAKARDLQLELSQLIEQGESQAKAAGKVASDKMKTLIEQAKHTRDSLATLVTAVKNGEADDKDLNDAIKKANEAKEALASYLKK